jgi:hypothetical protein
MSMAENSAATGGVEARLHVLLHVIRDGGECIGLCCGHFASEGNAPATNWLGGTEDPRAGLHASQNKGSGPILGSPAFSFVPWLRARTGHFQQCSPKLPLRRCARPRTALHTSPAVQRPVSVPFARCPLSMDVSLPQSILIY